MRAIQNENLKSFKAQNFKVFLVVLFLGLVAFVFMGCNESRAKNGEKHHIASHLTCHLEIENCEISYEKSLIEFSLEPKPVRAMVRQNLEILGLNLKSDELVAKISGVNMNMGIISSKLKRGEDGVFRGEVMFGSCVCDMLYDIEIFDGKTPLNLKAQIFIKR